MSAISKDRAVLTMATWRIKAVLFLVRGRHTIPSMMRQITKLIIDIPTPIYVIISSNNRSSSGMAVDIRIENDVRWLQVQVTVSFISETNLQPWSSQAPRLSKRPKFQKTH